MNKQNLLIKGSLEEGGALTCSLEAEKWGLSVRVKGNRPESDAYGFDIFLEALKQSVLHKSKSTNILLEYGIYATKEIPALCMYQENAHELPLVLVIHGYTGDKITVIQAGLHLAQAGFFVVLPDARLHGERRPPNFEKRFDAGFAKTFLQVLRGTSADISSLIDHFLGDSRADVMRTGVAGISMGGFAGFLAATQEPRIKVAAPIISSPDFTMLGKHPDLPPVDEKTADSLSRYSPLTNYEKLQRTSLLVQNGAKDKIVSVDGPRKLDAVLTKPGNTPKAYRYIEYADAGHEVTDGMIEHAVKWFTKYL